MVVFSTDVNNSIYIKAKGGGMAEVLAECNHKFLSGDRSSIMTVLIACSIYQETIPDWVADELLALDINIANGRYKDMNEFFNFGKPLNQITMEFLSNVKAKDRRVVSALFHHKTSGGNFRRVDLRGIADDLGISHKVVATIYANNQDWIDGLSKKTEANSGYIKGELTSLLELAKFKREQRDS